MSNNIEDYKKENETELEKQTDNGIQKKLPLFILLVVGTLLIGVLLFIFLNKKEKPQEQKQQETTIAKPEKKDFSFLPKNDEPLFFENNATKEGNFTPVVAPIPAPIIKGVSIMINESRSNVASNTASNETSLVNGGQSTISQNSTNNQVDIESDDFVGEIFTPSVASKSMYDPNFLLPKGSYIECSLDTRIVSQVKGGISCTVSNNVYSSNGKVLLIEKGSKINGTFKSDQLNDGINRLFVIWQEIRTYNNVKIPVFSGGSDPLGGSGVEGYVDHHWMTRFGSAILLSAIDDVFNVLAYNLNRQTNTSTVNIDYSENSRDAASDMASKALESFINIKPTLYKNHGDIVGVYVNRDIDFSKVYKLTYKQKSKSGN